MTVIVKGAALALACGVAACSSGSGSRGLETTVGPLVPAAEEAGATLARALEEGTEVQAAQAAGRTLDYASGATGIKGTAAFSVKANDKGGLTAVIDGHEMVFDASHLEDPDPNSGKVYGYFDENDGTFNGLFSYTGDIRQLLDGTDDDKMHILGTQTDPGKNGVNTRAYGVFGVTTPVAALETMATGRYDGYFQVDVAPDAGWVDNGASRSQLSGDLRMNADFARGTITGEVTRMQTRAPGSTNRVDVAGSIGMGTGTISGSGFRGTLSTDAALNSAIGGSLSGSYAGGFFGNAAQQIGGVTSMEGTWGGVESNAQGILKGDIRFDN